jgi:xanthosine utilization system XapX-like protein
VENTPGPEALPELGVLRVVRVLGLLLGVEVVEVAEELVGRNSSLSPRWFFPNWPVT